MTEKSAELNSIGGWLILPAVFFVCGPVAGLFRLIYAWEILQPFSLFTPSQLTLLRISTCIDVIVILATIFVGIIFFKKYQIAKKLCIGFFILLIIVGLFQFTLGYLLFGEVDIELVKNVVGPMVYGAIWIPYFLKSKRVKNTFTNPLDISSLSGFLDLLKRQKKAFFISAVLLFFVYLSFLSPRDTVKDCTLEYAVKAKSEKATRLLHQACQDLYDGSKEERQTATCMIENIPKAGNSWAVDLVEMACREKQGRDIPPSQGRDIFELEGIRP